ncbi:hypothetical protein AMTR_s00198p00037230 [Amborella trichopoda]|uniref:Uncharacterized protein n=1 Tax=Amborella trichopoda TaxID=13333 RepID=U5DHT4_AMBTC|nr:hypothetical protein AMTR_s00198p00037230 [Amborella trichopoda]
MLTSIGVETPSTISAEILITEAEVLVATPPSTEPSEVNAQPLLIAEANISTANAPDSNETDVVPPPLVEVNVPEVQAINPETDLVIVPAFPEALVQFTMKYSRIVRVFVTDEQDCSRCLRKLLSLKRLWLLCSLTSSPQGKWQLKIIDVIS